MGRDAYEDEPEDDRFSRPDFEPNALANALGSLNMLGDDVYLRMQATNVGLVDNFLNQLEAQVLREMVEQDGTPTSAFFVQAQTQMWIFALYELIRTWRGRSKQMVAWADNGIDLSPKSPPVLRRVLELIFGLKRPVFPVPDCWRTRWA